MGNDNTTRVSKECRRSRVFVALVLTVTPRHVVVLITFFELHMIAVNTVVLVVCLSLNYINCCLNPIIYLVKYEEFRNGVRAVLCSNRINQTAHGSNNAPH